jgi:hypothetical protein
MENILSLNEEIDVMIKKKLSVCKCNPCTCSENTKDIYFQELKDILARFNKETLCLNLMRIPFLINESQNYSITNY